MLYMLRDDKMDHLRRAAERWQDLSDPPHGASGPRMLAPTVPEPSSSWWRRGCLSDTFSGTLDAWAVSRGSAVLRPGDAQLLRCLGALEVDLLLRLWPPRPGC
jgi:hypothetical protein